jgi:hypothetical protein
MTLRGSWKRFRARGQALFDSDAPVPCSMGLPYSLSYCREDRIARAAIAGSSTTEEPADSQSVSEPKSPQDDSLEAPPSLGTDGSCM